MSMRLGFDLEYSSLHSRQGLRRLDEVFFDYLSHVNAKVYQDLTRFRSSPYTPSDSDHSALILSVTPFMSSFIERLFNTERNHLQSSDENIERLLRFRMQFVQKKPQGDLPCDDDLPRLMCWLESRLGVSCDKFKQCQVVDFGIRIIDSQDEVAMLSLQHWCYLVTSNAQYVKLVGDWAVFWRPQKIASLAVAAQSTGDGTVYTTARDQAVQRDDFSLVPSYWDHDQIGLHADYCKYCHDRSVDYCRTGFYQKKGDPSQGYRSDASGEVLEGCPLDEKVSEMHWFKSQFDHLSAFIAVMIDNPFCAITGHRICNDCMKSCIFQKQDPVDTPQVESRVVLDVLDMQWGVEIYDLLMKWHPLRRSESLPSLENERKVLVMGLGPSGFSMLHHLWMRGCHVTGMDGAHLEDWPFGDVFEPVQYFNDISQDLAQRSRLGFGGVCEYGITSRWDKNMLNIIYLSLLRRMGCRMLGNCRFGGTLDVHDAWSFGFDHLVLALGAGLPTALNIPNSLSKGMVQASDFLMSLHAIGAHDASQMTHLSIQLPCVVIGAGLTAIDAATEAQTYYLHMVQMVYFRLKKTRELLGGHGVKAAFSSQEYDRIQRWSQHGEAVIACKRQAIMQSKSPCYRMLLSKWGGVHIVYRKDMTDSPAYRKNHHELQAALDMGIVFHARTEVRGVDCDQHGFVSQVACLQPCLHGDDWSDVMVTCVERHGSLFYCQTSSQMSEMFRGLVVVLVNDLDGCCLSGEWLIHDLSQGGLILQSCYADASVLHTYLDRPVRLRVQQPKRLTHLPAKSVMVATGSQPNTAFEYEHRGHFERSKGFYQVFDLADDGFTLSGDGVDLSSGFFTSYVKGNYRISLVGDLHSRYHGSVVNALASSKEAVCDIMRHVNARPSAKPVTQQQLDVRLDEFRAYVMVNRRLDDRLHLLVIKAPWLCHKFKPGCFFRLQPMLKDRLGHQLDLGLDSVCLQPSDVHQGEQTLSFVFENDSMAKTRLLTAQVGDEVGCMGPSGVGLSPKALSKRVLVLVDEQRLLSVGPYYRHYLHSAQGVDLYVQSTPRTRAVVDALQLPHVEWIEGGVEDVLNVVKPKRNDYALIALQGSPQFVRSFYIALGHCYAQSEYTVPSMVGYVGGSMQCGLKGICAKCLQWQIDPDTGRRTKAVYACSWQDQPLELVDLGHLDQRYHACQAMQHLNQLWQRTSFKQSIDVFC